MTHYDYFLKRGTHRAPISISRHAAAAHCPRNPADFRFSVLMCARVALP